jgi:hypothetical protein
MSRRIVTLVASICTIACLFSFALAQETKETKPSLKVKGRLPAYYKDVVDDKQKEQIYSIQTKYNDQIKKLADEMKALTEKRDAEVAAVLTAEQKAKVDALKAEAAKKKADAKEPATESVKEPAKTTTTTPAKPAK